jgi:hypothetical protein
MPTVRTPYTDTTIQRRVISDMIGFIDWTEAPLLKRLGLETEKRFKFLNWPPGLSKKIEWLEDTMSPTADQLNGAIDASQTSIVVDNGQYFHMGHILEIDSEWMAVESVSTNTLTVARAQAGTSAATHADNAVVTVRGIAQLTGANYTIGHTTTMTAPYNYVQTPEEGIRVNDDQQMATDYGVADTMAYHLAKLIGGRSEIGSRGKAGQLTLLLCDMAYHGKRQAPTETVRGMAGGLSTFITTNLTGDTSTALSRPQIETQLRTIYTAGGKPDLIVTSPWGATKITSFYEGAVRTERSEQRGGSMIKYIDTPVLDNVEVMVDWRCPATKSYILDSEKVGWATIEPFAVRQFEPQGYYKVSSVKGDYSFIVQNEKAHSIITHSSTL